MYPTPAPPRAVDSHLAWAIVSIVLFWPLGVPAAVNAVRADRLAASGDQARAVRSAGAARSWARRATVVGIVWWVLSIACVPLAVSAAIDPTATAAWVREHL
ncbi:hypothetical protein GCM10022220_46550 [Actinocatenispora rupis]|uniref:Interferon-induced transmembrane protein n=1 Tax=Actinocatenispora rupis TaxID=519421 RepID=A0A8J3J9E6_9ACTN|nr:hypothetical protein Aru02nite_34560 [Actinocatenispora rupis]